MLDRYTTGPFRLIESKFIRCQTCLSSKCAMSFIACMDKHQPAITDILNVYCKTVCCCNAPRMVYFIKITRGENGI